MEEFLRTGRLNMIDPIFTSFVMGHLELRHDVIE